MAVDVTWTSDRMFSSEATLQWGKPGTGSQRGGTRYYSPYRWPIYALYRFLKPVKPRVFLVSSPEMIHSLGHILEETHPNVDHLS